MGSLQEHIDEFYNQGFTLMREVLSPAEVENLLAGVNRQFDGPEEGYGSILRMKMFERGEEFEALVDHAPVVDFAETVLGGNCHVIAMSAVTTPKNTGVDVWHADEEVIFPLPDDVEWDPRIRVPVLLFTCMYYLVDVMEDMGPTQLVPGSHRSGKQPNSGEEMPMYKGQGPVSILAKAGDCLIFSGQTWHRGARNQSDHPRIVQQVIYGKRWISQRFYPFIHYQMPQEILDRANPRRKRLLGVHPRGPYG